MKNKKGAIEHLREHQEYPATKKDLVSACYGLADFSKEDKKWFTKHLAEKSYSSAEEVMKAVHLDG